MNAIVPILDAMNKTEPVKERKERPIGQLYAFYHRCLGYAFKEFHDEREAILWGRTLGYQFEGKVNGQV